MKVMGVVCLFAFTGALSAAGGVCAAQSRETPIRRTILALYDSRAEPFPGETRIHRFAEAPLNHLGLNVAYHDISQGNPDVTTLQDVRGFLSWFSGVAVDDPDTYLRWATTAVADQRFFVVMGEFGVPYDAATSSPGILEQFTTLMGVVATGHFRPGPHDVTVVRKMSSMVEYERKLVGPLPGFHQFVIRGPNARSYLQVRLSNDEDTDSHPVVAADRGGFVASGYELYTDPRLGFVQWRINPFEFFRTAFQTDEIPKPDPTTVAGRRIVYAHVDGDGWSEVARLPRYGTQSTTCAEVVFDSILRPNPTLPVTVSAISGDLEGASRDSERARDIARRIFSLPHVEAASHTQSHPLVWERLRNADSDKDLPSTTPNPERKRARAATDNIASAITWPDRAWRLKYAGETGPYRVFTAAPFNLAAEVSGSAAAIAKLLPEGKTVRLISWTGDTRPYEEALAIAAAAGLPNINGGPFSYHQDYPSTASIAPVGLWVGSQFQVYGGNEYERSYTNGGGGRVPGLHHLKTVLSLTETPRRLRPFSVYWHMYDANNLGMLNGVLSQLALAQTMELAPVHTSSYARMASGFSSAKLYSLNERTWRIEDRGGLTTLRFDRAANKSVDFSASRGIVGQRHSRGSLYVALDNTEKAPIVALRDSDTIGYPPNAARPYLVHARWPVEALAVSGETFTFHTTGFGDGDMVWQVPQPGRYEIVAEQPAGRTVRTVSETGQQGRLIRFELPDGTGAPVRVVVSRRPDGS